MYLSEEHVILQATVRKFTENEVAPLAARMDREQWLPDGMFRQLGRLGLLGVTVPEAWGGSGGDALAQVIVAEELGKASAGYTLSYAAHSNLCTHNLSVHGNDDQRARYLPGLCSGEKVGALALTEPGAGSDAVGIRTTAVRDGGGYRLNGSKMFITNAPIADVFVVYAKTDPAKGAQGISAFVLERGFEGLRVGKKLEKMGCAASPTAEVVFEDCRVPAENLLGQENRGVEVMMSGLDIERVAVSGLGLGIAQAAFAESLRYAKERTQFGKPIGEFQLVQAKLADMYTSIEAARHLVYATALRTGSASRLRKESAAAVLFTGEMVMRVCLEAVQIWGGYGYMLETPVNRYLRDAKLFEIGAGTSEIRRILIARELLEGR